MVARLGPGSLARLVAVALAMGLIPGSGAAAAAQAPVCEPSCDDTTTSIADRLDGRGHDAWLATTLDMNGYRGKRWAEITRIPAGHGKRSVGVIHVPRGKANRVRRTLHGFAVAQKHTMFVLPLRSSTLTDGGSNENFREAARWAARRLGPGWKVR